MILDKYGNPLRMDRAYTRHGASYARKSLVSWQTSGASADEDIVIALDTLRARSRDLYMGSPLATGAIKTMRTNIVGSGLMLNPHIDYNFLGISKDDADAWEKTVKREFALWSSDTSCDATRSMTFYQLQSLVLMSALLSGDCFVAMPYIRRPGNPYSIKIYLIEGDRVCNPLTQSVVGANVLEGIEIGEYGEPVAYWIAKYHPYASAAFRQGKINEWRRVPVFGARSGRRNVLHIMPDFERPGQRRGVPLLSPVIELFKQLSRYTDAEVAAAVISGMFTGFVTSSSAGGIAPVNFGPANDPDPDGLAMGSGTIAYLSEGEDIKFGTPGRPNAGFGPFVESVCRQIGAALEIPYELLIKNFTSSYSAARASLLEAWKSFQMRRQWLVDAFCQPVFEEWLSEAVALGRVQAPGFFDDPALKKAWSRAEWAGDAQGQLDPLKEANAAVVRISNGLSTREKEAAELTGLSFDVIAAQLEREQTMLPAAQAPTVVSQSTEKDE